jgi:chromosome segregation ATPase
VFPIRFLLRHYPVRGQAHGERKIEKERRAAFAPEERKRGWHVQYDGVEPGQSFLRDPETLRPYDPALARVAVALRHRGVEELERQLAEEVRRREATEATLASVRRDLAVRAAEIEALNQAVSQRTEEVESLQAGLRERGQEIERLNASVNELARGLDARGVEVADLNRAVVETKAALAQRAREVEDLVRRLGETSLALDRTKQEALDLTADLESGRARLAAMEASLAWRVTAPLRAILDLVRGRKP